MMPNPWTCAHCQSEQTDERICQNCGRARFANLEIMICEHILEHIADAAEEGVVPSALDVLKLMSARPCYAHVSFRLADIQSRMRGVTKDTTALARQIAKARASSTMLQVLEHGDTKDKVAVLKGIQVLGETVDHNVTTHTTVKHVYEDATSKRDA